MLCYIQLCNRESVNVNGNSGIKSYISLRVSISFFLVFIWVCWAMMREGKIADCLQFKLLKSVMHSPFYHF